MGEGRFDRIDLALRLRPFLEELVFAAKRLYERGLVSGTGGNLSVKLNLDGSDVVLIKKSGGCLGDATTNDFMLVDLNGKPLDVRGNGLDLSPPAMASSRPEGFQNEGSVDLGDPGPERLASPGHESTKPSEETPMHLRLYGARQDILAIIHAHPPYSIAYAFGNRELRLYTVHSRMKLGKVPIIPFAPAGSEKLACLVAKKFSSDGLIRAALLKEHGVVTGAKTLREAFYLTDLVEETAKVAYLLACRKS